MSEHQDPHNIDELKHELQSHDEWFRHAPNEEHQVAHGDFNPLVVMTFLAVTILIVFGVAFIVVPWFARMVQERRVEVFEDNPAFAMEYMEAHETWVAELTGEPTWIDEKTNVVRIPIDMAMRQVIKRYEGQQRSEVPAQAE